MITARSIAVRGLVLLAALLATLFCTSCTGSTKGKPTVRPTATGSMPPGAPKTFEDAVAARLGPDGSVPKDLALDAWSALIGPLPGWTPKQHLVGTGAISGTIAVRMVYGHWHELTEAQRAAVLAFGRAPTSPAPSSHATRFLATGVLDTMSALQDRIRAQVPAAIEAITHLIGRSLTVPFKAFVNATHVGVPDEYAATTAVVARDGHSLEGCNGRFNPDMFPTAGEILSVVIHEVFHCFQFALYPSNFLATDSIADWIMEGEAAWVGETLSGGSLAPARGNWWYDWLAEPYVKLYDRSYSSIGLFADVQAVTHDVASKLDAMVLHPIDAYSILLGSSATATIRRQWATRLVRDPSFGAEWESVGPGLTSDRAAHETQSLNASSETTVPLVPGERTAGIDDVQLAGDAVLVELLQPSAVGALHMADGSTAQLDGGAPVSICLKSGGCACPDGTDPLGHSTPGADGQAVLAASADATAQVRFTPLTLGPCTHHTGSPPPSGDRALVGTWRSVRWRMPPVVADRTAGGAGMSLTFNANGSAQADFSRMTPVTMSKASAGVDTTSTFVYRGSGAATWSSGSGVLHIVYGDPHAFHYHFAFSVAGTSVPPVDGDFGQPVSGTSPAGGLTRADYAAAGSTLVLTMTIPRGLGSIQIFFEKS